MSWWKWGRDCNCTWLDASCMAVGTRRYEHSVQYNRDILQDHLVASIWKPWVAVSAMRRQPCGWLISCFYCLLSAGCTPQ